MYFLNKKNYLFTKIKNSNGGRNNLGSIIVRHRKNIIKKKYIKIDQLRTQFIIPARVKYLSKHYLTK
jgi:ribosomal protein L2